LFKIEEFIYVVSRIKCELLTRYFYILTEINFTLAAAENEEANLSRMDWFAGFSLTHDQPDAREGQAGRLGVAERFVVPGKPGNAGGGKGPQFKTNAGRRKRQEIGQPINSRKYSETAEGVTRESEG